ncbi:putative Ig domain-containing protein, partial [Microcoleus sp. C2C3]|uniref:putative Ig domain-containing protein n=1 Tax=Microcoleus sp. C2C3 TaxID=3055324 RepID=UPI002FD2C1AA
GLPKGLSIDAATGTISGTIDRSASQVGDGTYTVTVTAHDRAAVPEGEAANPDALSVNASFTLTVANPAPVLEADSGRTAEDTPLAVTVAEGLLFNDKDGAPDSDPLTVTQFTFAVAEDAGDDAGDAGDNDGDVGGDASDATTAPPIYKAGEKAEIAGVGSLTIHANGSYTFVPADDYDGEVPIATYWVSDREGGVAEATLALAITPVNDAPVAKPLDDRTAKDGEIVSYALADRFSDIEKDTLRYVATGLPKGLSIDAATGTISGTIDRSASQVDGGTYTVTVTAHDRAAVPEGEAANPEALSVSASFTLTVANPAPVLAADSGRTAEDTTLAVTVAEGLLFNDTDGAPDSDPLT